MSPPPNPPAVRKAIFPVAGIGSRFLPLTLAVPKEMIPVVDTPLLHHAVAEALEAGVEECIFVVSPERGQRRVIEDYFCDNGALEHRLRSAGKADQAARWRALLPRPRRVRFVAQERPLGLGNAIWLARRLVGEEDFAVLLPDELLISRPGCLARLTAASAAPGAPGGGFLLAMQPVARAACSRYGILDVGDVGALDEDAIGAQPVDILGVAEKPAPEAAPSRLAIIGRYILPAAVLPLLAPGGELREGEETPLTDALAALIAQGAPARGLLFSGERYDCGDKAGLVAATLACARKRDDLAGALA